MGMGCRCKYRTCQAVCFKGYDLPWASVRHVQTCSEHKHQVAGVLPGPLHHLPYSTGAEVAQGKAGVQEEEAAKRCEHTEYACTSPHA